jgi:hypothetical protein
MSVIASAQSARGPVAFVIEASAQRNNVGSDTEMSLQLQNDLLENLDGTSTSCLDDDAYHQLPETASDSTTGTNGTVEHEISSSCCNTEHALLSANGASDDGSQSTTSPVWRI